MAQNRDDYAIVVGVDRYPVLGLAMPEAGSKAREFAQWLTEPEGGGLPAANVSLLLPERGQDSDDPGPQLWQVHRALGELGAGGGARAGRRLYACFAGCAVGRDLDDLALLLADAGPEGRPVAPALDLKRHLEHQQRTVTYDELVLVADVRRVAARVDAQAPPFPTPDRQPTPVDEAGELLMVGDGIIPDLLAILGEEASQRGPRWRLKAPELVDRFRSRRGAAAWLVTAQAGTVVFGATSPTAAPEGSVVVEVPHWAARVSVLDGMLRPLAEAGPPEPDGSGRYTARVPLPSGVYTVEARLGGATARRSVVVASGTETKVTLGSPTAGQAARGAGDVAPSADTPSVRDVAATPAQGQRLELVSPAPLADTPTTREWHAEPAAEWSRRPTWAPPDGSGRDGDAGLLVFVRTLEPSKGFADGLALLDGDGRVVTRLAGKAVERDSRHGWLAFNARLRPGPYLLRREQRPGVAPLRHQPLHLCAGWDAQVFLAAKRFPSLGSMTLHMVPRGAGFDPADRAAAATQALFDALRSGVRAATALVTSPGLLPEIRRAQAHAPWLAVLAAQALRAGEAADAPGRNPDLLRKLVEGLVARIGDHPDVRALRLDRAERAAAPFAHPPLLRAGLQRVLRHATRFADTVPVGSLTDRVAAGVLVTNSPWTAWRDLDRRPAVPPQPAAGREALLARVLEGALSARAPVFPVPPARAAMKDQPESDSGPAITGEEGAAAAPVEVVLDDLPLIVAARSLIAVADAGGTPERNVILDPARAADDLLSRVQPPEASTATGVPLPRVEHGLERLRDAARGASETATAPPPGDAPGPELAAAEAAIVQYALRLPADDGPPGSAAVVAAGLSLTIEGCAQALRAEAEDLRQALGDRLEAATPDIAGRLERAADELMRRADLVAITDQDLRLRYANGALLARMEAAGDPLGERLAFEARLREERLRGEARQAAGDAQAGVQADRQGAAPPVSGQAVLSAVRDEAGGPVRGYVAVLPGREADRVAPEVLAGVDRLLPRLTLFASLYGRDPARRGAGYRDRLEAVVSDIEGLVR